MEKCFKVFKSVYGESLKVAEMKLYGDLSFYSQREKAGDNFCLEALSE